jgi:hypothetical protein
LSGYRLRTAHESEERWRKGTNVEAISQSGRTWSIRLSSLPADYASEQDGYYQSAAEIALVRRQEKEIVFSLVATRVILEQTVAKLLSSIDVFQARFWSQKWLEE